ncbi:SusC/RagA family TonB-linked outer membrane protein [Tenacibaculum xiamenense]|uniref:SusC/RagA family TonB-linked outer membrane protein n=1 Tax=Tenacibaculum xiamenense TaxID=1261553 RepID=UPI0038966621
MIQKILKLLLIVLAFTAQSLYAQKVVVKGTVTDQNDGSPLPGVNVLERGTSNGALTDIDGKYSISVSSKNAVLQFSFLGYETKEVSIQGKSTLNVSIAESSETLNEVVVTALGIKRERKALGYSVQELKGGAIAETGETNISNALTGKVAGVQILRGSNGPAGSSKIILRGNNSLTGDNQPLIVVDGIPMDNFTGASNNDFFNPTEDLGNGLQDLNPEDIESMSVLKGASAAALYGSRAGNGVILITTKTGKKQNGLGISYSVTTGIQNIFITPELQNSFGQGSQGIYDREATSSWGPRIEGQILENWQGINEPYAARDNIKNYFRGGVNQTHNLSFQQQVSEDMSMYSSLSYVDDDSNIPGATLEKLNLSTRAVAKFGPNKSWTTDIKVQYINTKAENRPLNGNNLNNVFGNIVGLPRTVDITSLRDHTDENGNMIWYLPNSNAINPYWAAEKNMRVGTRDRFLLNASLKNQINDWLSVELKGGADLYTNNTESKLYAGSRSNPNGTYSLGKNTFIEKNFSALAVASKDNLFGKFGGTVSIGGNLMHQRRSGIHSSAGQLEVPDLFELNNGVNRPSVTQNFSEKKINSVYGMLQLNYDGYLFVDITGRNDWSSALSKSNRSFFYPSFSTSLVFTDMIRKNGGSLPEWLSFGKIRGSYATVGNDLNPYQLYNVYSIGKDSNGNTTATTGDVLYNPDIKNELIRSLEFGFEGRFLNNRIGVDFTWYKSNATNQILDIAMDPFSGFSARKINAGDIQNKGFELTLSADIFKNEEGFSWNSSLNYSKNENTIERLTDDVTQFRLGGFDNLAILAIAGGQYGEIRGTRYRRVDDPNSQYNGQIIVDANGLPSGVEDSSHTLGSQQPDALIGFTNSFSYKNVSFSFLIDARIGGEIFSGTNMVLQSSGSAAKTVVNGGREDIVFGGVVEDGNGGYTPNTTAVSPQVLWGAITSSSGNLGIAEANIYDATNIRLRNINVSYKLPQKWLAKTFIKRAKLGVSANNVWMIKSHLNGVDPESVFATGTNATGFEYLSSPTTRTLFFNASINF